jgi:hypothetical protein
MCSAFGSGGQEVDCPLEGGACLRTIEVELALLPRHNPSSGTMTASMRMAEKPYRSAVI